MSRAGLQEQQLPAAQGAHAAQCSASTAGPEPQATAALPCMQKWATHAPALPGSKSACCGNAGCLAFGHSGGGLAAALAEARCPGTFAAMYLYEPVLLKGGDRCAPVPEEVVLGCDVLLQCWSKVAWSGMQQPHVGPPWILRFIYF